MLHPLFGEDFHQTEAHEYCIGNLEGQNIYLCSFGREGEHTADIYIS
uniref:Uncharacterized protein n=1 Tax=Arundo donax TaxID=35708 RepID=A0A0A9C7C8_ARUDO